MTSMESSDGLSYTLGIKMSIWKKISLMAKDMLGNTQAKSVNFSQISQEINPPNNIAEHSGPKINKGDMDVSEIEVLPEYKFILKAVTEKCPAIFVAGGAGTGKSTLVQYLKSQIMRSAVVAPTGIAAINVKGSTIHSFFNIPPLDIINSDEAFKPSNKESLEVIRNLDVLIVDEVSMVRPDIVDAISNSLKKIRKCKDPFGGVSIVFIGDLLQLPPVIGDDVVEYFNDKYGSPYFYSAEIFKDTDIFPVELTKVFRQKDMEFIEALGRIRTDNDCRSSVALFNRKCYRDKEKTDELAACLVPTNAKAESINKKYLEALPSKHYSFKAEYSKQWIANSEQRDTDKKLPAPDKLVIKIGARVIFVKNNKKFWHNGSIGEIVSITTDTPACIGVKLAETGKIVSVSKETWEKLEYKYDGATKRIESKVIGTFTQFPLSLGWAITIHKSQGMTLDSVQIDLGRGAFCYGQTYVALSRCRTIDGITLVKPISMGDIKVDAAVIEFYKKLGFLKKGDASQC